MKNLIFHFKKELLLLIIGVAGVCTGTYSQCNPVITQNPNHAFVCSGGNTSFSVSASGTGLTYQWKENGANITNGGVYGGATTTMLTLTGVPGFFDLRQYSCTVTGCSSVSSNSATLSVGATQNPAVYISGPSSVCAGQTATFLAMPMNAGLNPTYQWQVNGFNVGTNSTSYSSSTLANGSVVRCILTANDACSQGSGISNTITVIVNPLPTASISATGPTTFCSGGSVMLNANSGAGLTYQWKLNSVNIGGATSASFLASASGNYNCAVSNSCGNITSNTITVAVEFSPSAVISSAGNPNICTGSSVTLSANTGAGLSYQWRRNLTFIPGATANSYAATLAGSYDCQVSNTCGNAISNTIIVTISSIPSAVITASGATTFCTPGSVTLNANTGSGLSYQWRLNSSIIAGATTSSWLAATSGSYSCSVSNLCGASVSNSISVTVNNSPAAPGSISGPTSGVCSSAKIFSISPVASATSYLWTAPSGSSVTGGQGTTSATVTFTGSFGGGNVSVTAVNACGSSASSILPVSGAPAQPGTITGPLSVCRNQNNVTYSVAAVASATSYTWTVPAGAQIKTGQGTRTIKVRFGNSAGNVTVKANNSCGSGPVRSIAVAMPCRESGEDMISSSPEINVYPNPASNEFTFMISSPYSNLCALNIYDLSGRIVEQHQVEPVNGEFKCGSRLTQGIYYTEIISGNSRTVLKLIKE